MERVPGGVAFRPFQDGPSLEVRKERIEWQRTSPLPEPSSRSNFRASFFLQDLLPYIQMQNMTLKIKPLLPRIRIE
ncbi:hypothetical protein JTE90_022256 [Oedothorax gibbosus]|uniref:Uncharacterized protein n=1 Tax=Oedothorax gibbosus TaxID=931172 RepID=A0AAV6VY34_9ARAC|nr:hypothetical protein JTE90_022256 [Oedothorax gibbosus]